MDVDVDGGPDRYRGTDLRSVSSDPDREPRDPAGVLQVNVFRVTAAGLPWQERAATWEVVRGKTKKNRKEKEKKRNRRRNNGRKREKLKKCEGKKGSPHSGQSGI